MVKLWQILLNFCISHAAAMEFTSHSKVYTFAHAKKKTINVIKKKTMQIQLKCYQCEYYCIKWMKHKAPCDQREGGENEF